MSPTDAVITASRIRRLVTNLEETGTPVPDEVTAAANFARLRPTFESATIKVWPQVAAATSEAQLTKAMADLRVARSADAQRDTADADLETLRANVLLTAVSDTAGELYRSLCDRANVLTEQWETEVASALPAIVMASNPLTLSPAEFAVIARAHELVASLSPLVAASDSLGVVLGDGSDHVVVPTDLIDRVFQLGTPETMAQVSAATGNLFGVLRGLGGAEKHAPFDPFIGLSAAGIPLELHTPAETAALRQRVQFGYEVAA